MLTINKLNKRFGDHVAVKALDLTVAPGQIYALLGPNGAGKSTTINCCLGFVRPDGGAVRVDDFDPAVDPQGARARLAYIPEQVNLYDTFSGLENLKYLAELGRRRLDRDELVSLLRTTGLSEGAVDRPVRGYSKGMRQKVGIAIALAKQASVLLLDEPTSGLDPSASHDFGALMARLSATGVAILMATHDIFRALDTATTIGILIDGELVAERAAAGLTAVELERQYLDATSNR